MEAHIDKFGRIVIPKSIRDHLGLKPGVSLEVEEINHDIILRLINPINPISNKDGIAVFSGNPTDNFDSIISQERDDRIKKIWKPN